MENSIFTQSGTTGKLAWSFSDGTLTVGGSGTMPDYDDDETESPWYDFRENITAVIIGDGVTSIGGEAFYECGSLTSMTIPDSVKEIGDWAFSDCSNLTSVTIPKGVKKLGWAAFYKCHSLTSVIIPDGVTSIGNEAFSECSSLTSVIIPDSVTSIGYRAFSECGSLMSVTIPESVTSIDDRAFYGCSSLTSVSIPESVTSIGDWAFYGCSSLTSVTIPESVTEIGKKAFPDALFAKKKGNSGTGKKEKARSENSMIERLYRLNSKTEEEAFKKALNKLAENGLKVEDEDIETLFSTLESFLPPEENEEETLASFSEAALESMSDATLDRLLKATFDRLEATVEMMSIDRSDPKREEETFKKALKKLAELTSLVPILEFFATDKGEVFEETLERFAKLASQVLYRESFITMEESIMMAFIAEKPLEVGDDEEDEDKKTSSKAVKLAAKKLAANLACIEKNFLSSPPL